MKHLLIIAALLIGLASCKKDSLFNDTPNKYLQNAKAILKDSITKIDFQNLDFTRSIQSRINQDTSFLRIPSKGKSIKNEFVLLQTDDNGKIARGRKISLSRTPVQNSADPTNFNGSIIIQNLKGDQLTNSEIVNGFIVDFRIRSSAYGTNSSLDPYVTLPEVVVVGYRSSGGGISFGDLIRLQGLFGGSFEGSSGYYSSVDAQTDDTGGGGGGGAGGGSTGGGPTDDGTSQDPPILIDFENQDIGPSVEIQKYLDCFSSIPDDGATCTIEILADIAVDGDPTIFFNWDTRSPGHVFLKINKANGSQSVQQSIGWYPKDGYKTVLTTAPITGKFVDNQRHEYNAAYTMDITSTQLQSAITMILYLSRFIKYDVDEYNCVDFSLDVFNNTVSPYDALEIPKYNLPGTTNSFGSSTPNGLYQKLQSIKQAGGATATKVNIPGVKGWVGSSDGPCN